MFVDLRGRRSRTSNLPGLHATAAWRASWHREARQQSQLGGPSPCGSGHHEALAGAARGALQLVHGLRERHVQSDSALVCQDDDGPEAGSQGVGQCSVEVVTRGGLQPVP